jgi:hypothetical protein
MGNDFSLVGLHHAVEQLQAVPVGDEVLDRNGRKWLFMRLYLVETKGNRGVCADLLAIGKCAGAAWFYSPELPG